MNITTDSAGLTRQVILVKFSIFKTEGGPVPDGAAIDSAALSLYQTSSSDRTAKGAARRVLVPWSEFDATATYATTGAKWSEQCAAEPGKDIASTLDGISPMPPDDGWLTIDVTAGVRAFALGTANEGWRVAFESRQFTLRSFASRESRVPANRPKLVIKFRSKQ